MQEKLIGSRTYYVTLKVCVTADSPEEADERVTDAIDPASPTLKDHFDHMEVIEIKDVTGKYGN